MPSKCTHTVAWQLQLTLVSRARIGSWCSQRAMFINGRGPLHHRQGSFRHCRSLVDTPVLCPDCPLASGYLLCGESTGGRLGVVVVIVWGCDPLLILLIISILLILLILFNTTTFFCTTVYSSSEAMARTDRCCCRTFLRV